MNGVCSTFFGMLGLSFTDEDHCVVWTNGLGPANEPNACSSVSNRKSEYRIRYGLCYRKNGHWVIDESYKGVHFECLDENKSEKKDQIANKIFRTILPEDISSVIRFVVTHIDRNGERTLTNARQGRYTFSSREECQKAVVAISKNNPKDKISQIFGEQAVGTFECKPVQCYSALNHDPKTCWF